MTLTHHSLLVIDPDKVIVNPNDCPEEPKVVEVCRAAKPRWSYANGLCEEFNYGGCGGTRDDLCLKAL